MKRWSVAREVVEEAEEAEEVAAGEEEEAEEAEEGAGASRPGSKCCAVAGTARYYSPSQ